MALNCRVVYRPLFDDTINHLGNGIKDFSVYWQNLKAPLNESQDEINYIKYKLFPSLDTAKRQFDIMKKCADKLLEQVNHDLERCIADVTRKNQTLNTITMNITDLQTKLDRSQEKILNAEKQCERKKMELSKANDALSTAVDKLFAANENQTKTVVTGTATTVVSGILALAFPPALLGVVGGLATTTAGLTVFEVTKRECERQANTARQEVASSRIDLENAKKNKENIEQEIEESIKKMKKAEEEKRLALMINEQIKEYLSQSIYLNESIKGFYRDICNLTGKIRVLYMETDGGYSLSMLKEPSIVVLDSLYSVLCCPALCDARNPNIERLTKQLRAIKSGKSEYSFNPICFIFAVVFLSIIVFRLLG